MDEVDFNLHLTCHFKWKGLSQTKMPMNSSNSKGSSLYLVVVVCCEGVTEYDVTLVAHNTNKFFEFHSYHGSS